MVLKSLDFSHFSFSGFLLSFSNFYFSFSFHHCFSLGVSSPHSSPILSTLLLSSPSLGPEALRVKLSITQVGNSGGGGGKGEEKSWAMVGGGEWTVHDPRTLRNVLMGRRPGHVTPA